MKNKKLLFILIITAFCCQSCKMYNTNGTTVEAVKPIQVTTQEFNLKIANSNSSIWKYLGDKPAIIDFYADWCGPCKMMSPSLDALAAKYDGQIYIYKVNIDNEPQLAKAFGISSIPSLLFIPMKGEPQRMNGVRPKFIIDNKIKSTLLH